MNGNHDLFEQGSCTVLKAREGVTMLDDPGLVQVKGLRIAGQGGIVGRADKPNRREQKIFLQGVRNLLRAQPDILLLHQGPDAPSEKLPGLPEIRECLLPYPPVLVCCGHVHWERPYVELESGTQVLNADGKVFVFTKPASDAS